MKEELVEKALGEPYDKEKMEKLLTLICSAPFPLLALHHALEKKAFNTIEQSHKEIVEEIDKLKNSRILSIEGNHASKRMTQGYHKALRDVLKLIHSNNKSNESSKN